MMHHINITLDEDGEILLTMGVDADYWLAEGEINEAQATTIRKIKEFLATLPGELYVGDGEK